MKTYKLLYPLLPFLLLAACDNAPNGDVHTDAHRNVEIYDDNDTMRDYEEVINRRTADDRFGKELTDALYHENLERDRSKMYADIGMSAAEIEQFEENYRMRLGELKGTKTICQKAVKVTDSGNYKYYVALELSGQDLLTKMNERLGSDERLKIDYDYEKFKETFNEEMEKMKK